MPDLISDLLDKVAEFIEDVGEAIPDDVAELIPVVGASITGVKATRKVHKSIVLFGKHGTDSREACDAAGGAALDVTQIVSGLAGANTYVKATRLIVDSTGYLTGKIGGEEYRFSSDSVLGLVIYKIIN